MTPVLPNSGEAKKRGQVFEPLDYAIEVCRICGAQLDRAHGAADTLRCAVREHGPSGAMLVRVSPLPDDEQTHRSYKTGVVAPRPNTRGGG